MKKLIGIALIAIAFMACSKESDPVVNANPNQNGGGNNTVVSLEDTISRKWKVANATHNGSADNSSKGLELDIRKDGSYTLITTGFIGTWEFQNNKTEVLLDKDNASFKTVWTIESMSSTALNVKFKSPFTGGNAAWNMVAN